MLIILIQVLFLFGKGSVSGIQAHFKLWLTSLFLQIKEHVLTATCLCAFDKGMNVENFGQKSIDLKNASQDSMLQPKLTDSHIHN